MLEISVTQAANFMKVSRPIVIKLVNDGNISHRVTKSANGVDMFMLPVADVMRAIECRESHKRFELQVIVNGKKQLSEFINNFSPAGSPHSSFGNDSALPPSVESAEGKL